MVFNGKHASTVSAGNGRGLVGWLIEVIGAQKRQHGRRRQMELLETLPLGSKRHLMLVNCDGTRFLVGANGDAPMTIVKLKKAESSGDQSVEMARQ